MRRILSLSLVLGLLALCIFSVCCAAAGAPDPTQAVPTLDKNFDVNLATTLIVIISTLLVAAILVCFIVLAKRNMHN